MRLLKKMLLASLGLFVNGFGVYLTIQASVGLAPWDVLNVALTKHLPISFGVISMIIGFTLLAVDIALGEPIGVGMILDTVIVGNSVDLYTSLALFPVQTKMLPGIVCLLAGLAGIAVSQWIYMSAGIGCGPRDTLLVALGKRLKKLPIGAVQIMILFVVLVLGWVLGGPVGIGTVISVCGLGAIQQLVFHLAHFEPRNVKHESILDSLRSLQKRK